jgi:hypothetical protein
VRSSIKCEKENLILQAVKYLEEKFLDQGNIERCTTVSDTFAWPTGITLEDYNVIEVTTLVEHFKKQLSPLNKNDDCMQDLPNEWYEFKVLGRERS